MMSANTCAASYVACPPVGVIFTCALFCLASLITWRLCWRTLLCVSDGRLPRSLIVAVSHCQPFCASPLANLWSNLARWRAWLSHATQRSKRAFASRRTSASPRCGRAIDGVEFTCCASAHSPESYERWCAPASAAAAGCRARSRRLRPPSAAVHRGAASGRCPPEAAVAHRRYARRRRTALPAPQTHAVRAVPWRAPDPASPPPAPGRCVSAEEDTARPVGAACSIGRPSALVRTLSAAAISAAVATTARGVLCGQHLLELLQRLLAADVRIGLHALRELRQVIHAGAGIAIHGESGRPQDAHGLWSLRTRRVEAVQVLVHLIGPLLQGPRHRGRLRRGRWCHHGGRQRIAAECRGVPHGERVQRGGVPRRSQIAGAARQQGAELLAEDAAEQVPPAAAATHRRADQLGEGWEA